MSEFLSKKSLKLLTDPLNDNNPITVQVLGICSALAVTVKVEPAIVMGLSVIVVTAMANLIVSLLRNTIPDRIRIIVQLVIVAALVILVDQVLKAYAYEVSRQLSVFVGLIITNCIIMGRLEAFALANKPGAAFLDGIGNGLGYAVILILIAVIREIFGAGTITLPGLGELPVIPQAFYDFGYKNNGLVILPPMALIVVGLIIWFQRAKNKGLIESK